MSPPEKDSTKMDLYYQQQNVGLWL